MRCLLWRQHRGQLLWSVVTLAVFCAFMLAVAYTADHWLTHYHHWLAQLSSAGCHLPDKGAGGVHTQSATCQGLLSQYPDGQQPAFASAYNFAIPVFEEGLPLIVVLVGVLVGAPLVAREVE